MTHSTDIPPEILALRDQAAIATARKVAEQARQNMLAAKERLAEAQGKVKAAEAARDDLVAAAGDADAPKRLRAVESRIAEAERAEGFAAEVVTASDGVYQAAACPAIRKAEAAAWEPIVRAAAALRIAAARRIDALNAEIHRAEALFGIGVAATMRASMAGYPLVQVVAGAPFETVAAQQRRLDPDGISLSDERQTWRDLLPDTRGEETVVDPAVAALIDTAGCGT